jgi:hypothetical protein
MTKKTKPCDEDAMATLIIKKCLANLPLLRKHMDNLDKNGGCYSEYRNIFSNAEKVWWNIERVAGIRLKVARDCLKVIEKKAKKKK